MAHNSAPTNSKHSCKSKIFQQGLYYSAKSKRKFIKLINFFLFQIQSAGNTVPPPAKPKVVLTAPVDNTVDMRTQLMNKQKELLELQQKKLELELLQAKVKLEEQQKQYAKVQKTTRKVSTNAATASTTTVASVSFLLFYIFNLEIF